MQKRRRLFPVKRLPDGRAMLNLGCSARVAPGWNNIDFSWLIWLAKRPFLSRLLRRIGVVSQARFDRLLQVDPETRLWNLTRGIPYPDAAFDVVYHSHVLEHIDREHAPGFLVECLRVLKPGGVLRVVVPDLEQSARSYVRLMDRPMAGIVPAEHHFVTEEMFDQMVRRIPKGREALGFCPRLLESVFVGDTARSGTQHRWMYDRVSLHFLLESLGFVTFQVRTVCTSEIAGWQNFCLDNEPDGTAYKHSSLYVETRRPPQLAAVCDGGSGTVVGYRKAR